MAGIPSHKFTCKECGSQLSLIRKTMEEFEIEPCANCLKKAAKPATAFQGRKNLLYHITPTANWRWNIEQLVKRIHIFDGQLAFAIAQDPNNKFVPYEEVCLHIARMIPDHKGMMHFQPIANHPELRETHSLASLLLTAHTMFGKDDVTFYAHTKGVTRGDDPAVELWTDAMYHFNLDHVEVVEKLLAKYPTVGCFKRRGTFAHFPKASRWHYSGTFFWFRNKDLFSNQRWTQVPQIRYGAESYISLMFKDQEAGVIFGDHFKDGYKIDYLHTLLRNNVYFKKAIAKNLAHNSNRNAPETVSVVRAMDRKSNTIPG